MEVNVKMTTDEFLEFMEWTKDKKRYKEEASRIAKRLEVFCKKVCWALESDKKRTGKAKIADQDHADELLEMARKFLA